MNTVDCIRKFGWEWARESYFFIEEHKHIASSIYFIYQNQLKRYIDAWELVQKQGGLSEAKVIEQQYWNSGVGSAMIVSMELKQAIALVEEVEK